MGDGVIILRDLIGSKLREIRVGKNLTLRSVADDATVSYSYLSELERGQKEASSEILAAICGALQVPMSDVLYAVTEKVAQTEEVKNEYA